MSSVRPESAAAPVPDNAPGLAHPAWLARLLPRLPAWLPVAALGNLVAKLLIVALGLAITYGLMGVINMAHGELMMIGAYATYLVQVAFRQWLPGGFDLYLVAAVPVSFLASALVGAALQCREVGCRAGRWRRWRRRQRATQALVRACEVLVKCLV